MFNVKLEGYEMPADIALRALYQYARVQGMGILHAKEGGLPVEEAKAMANGDTSFYVDYLHGRVMKVDFEPKRALDLRLYVRDNGTGAVQAALNYALDLLTTPTK